jgi:hypothetical protein
VARAAVIVKDFPVVKAKVFSKSGCAWGMRHVERLLLREVRWAGGGGSGTRDFDRAIHPFPSGWIARSAR